MFKKSLFLILYCLVTLASTGQTIKTLTIQVGKTYIGLDSANMVSPDIVEYLYIDCDKIDSIDSRITKFKNLKSLILVPCYYSSAYRLNLLNDKEKRYYLSKLHKADSLNNAQAKLHQEGNVYTADWDKVYFVNRIKGISNDLYKLNKLEFIQIDVKVKKSTKEFVEQYVKRKRVCVMIKESCYGKCP